MKTRSSEPQVRRFLDAWFAARQFIQASNFNRFQGAGLSATQFMTLNLLPQAGDGLAMGELARALNLRPATVAKTVDSLEARSLVTRIRNQADKRSLVVRVTPDGMALQNAAHSHFQAQIASLFRAMSPADREGLVAGLEALVEAAATQAPTLGHPPIPVAHGAVPAKRSVRQVQPK